MYMRELDERKLDRAMALDKVTTRHTIKVTRMKTISDTITHRPRRILKQMIRSHFQEGSLPRITLPGQGRDNVQDVDSDQESVRNMCSDNRRGQAKIRRHTLPPILPEADL